MNDGIKTVLAIALAVFIACSLFLALAWPISMLVRQEQRYYQPEPARNYHRCKRAGGLVVTDSSGTYCVYPSTAAKQGA